MRSPALVGIRLGDDVAVNAEARELPVERVPGRARLVANLQLRWIAQLPEQPPDRLRTVGDCPQRPGLVSALRHRHRNRFRVYVHAYKSGNLAHATGSFHV